MPSVDPREGAGSQNWAEPPQLRALRRTVVVLMATLVIGVLTIATTLVIRILMEPARPAIAQVDADQVTLPAGEEIIAVGAAAGGLSIATRDPAGRERLRVFDPETGAAIGETLIERR